MIVQCMYARIMWPTSPTVPTPAGGSTAASAVRLAALSALLAAAVLQLRRLRRLQADLQRAEVRACPCTANVLPAVAPALCSRPSVVRSFRVFLHELPATCLMMMSSDCTPSACRRKLDLRQRSVGQSVRDGSKQRYGGDGLPCQRTR